MDIATLLALGASLASAASAATEWFKSWLTRLAPDMADDTRVLVVQAFALMACIAAALAADFDLLHALFPSVSVPRTLAVVLSGIALALPADGIKVLLQLLKAGRDTLDTPRGTSGTSVKLEAQTVTTTAAPSSPEMNGADFRDSLPHR